MLALFGEGVVWGHLGVVSELWVPFVVEFFQKCEGDSGRIPDSCDDGATCVYSKQKRMNSKA